MIIFCSSEKLLHLLNKCVVNINEKHFKIKFSATENTSVN